MLEKLRKYAVAHIIYTLSVEKNNTNKRVANDFIAIFSSLHQIKKSNNNCKCNNTHIL